MHVYLWAKYLGPGNELKEIWGHDPEFSFQGGNSKALEKVVVSGVWQNIVLGKDIKLEQVWFVGTNFDNTRYYFLHLKVLIGMDL